MVRLLPHMLRTSSNGASSKKTATALQNTTICQRVHAAASGRLVNMTDELGTLAIAKPMLLASRSSPICP
jgi:hypothetical protein